MGITAVRKVDHSAEQTTKGEICTVLYRVEFDAVPSDIRVCLTATDGGTTIPIIGQKWDGSQTIRCKNVGPVRKDDESNLIYYVPTRFDNINSGTAITSDDPLDRPADVRFGVEAFSVPLEEDINGNPVINSAGDKFDPPLDGIMYLPKITIERNVSEYSFNPTLAYSLVDTVASNSGKLAGIPIESGQALMRDYQAEAVYEGSETYIREHFEILLKPSHKVKVGDMGLYYIDASDDDKRKRFVDGDGKQTTVPMYLTSGGDDGGGTVRYIEFEVKESASWAALGLPSDFVTD